MSRSDDGDDAFSDMPTPRPEDSDRGRSRRVTESVEINVSEFDEPSKVTDPIEWMERDLDDSEQDLLVRSGSRSAGDSVSRGQFIKLVRRHDDRERKWRKAFRWFASEVKAIRAVISPRWIEEVKGAVGTIRAAKKLLWGAVSAVVVSLGVFVGAIWQRSAQETEARIRLEQVQAEAAKCHSEIGVVDARQSADLRHEIELLRAEINGLRDQLYRRSHTSTKTSSATTLATLKGN